MRVLRDLNCDFRLQSLRTQLFLPSVTRPMTVEGPSALMIEYTHSCTDIAADFQRHGIDISSPGFYNHPNFIRIEKQSPRYLNNYARFVQCKAYSQDYLQHAERVLNTVARIISNEIIADGRLGACIDASGTLEQMLVREGIWCYQVKGALTVTFPLLSKLPATHFYPITAPGESEALAAHSWLVVPPFNVVDLTIKMQQYRKGAMDYLPDMILEKSVRETEVYTTEICSPASFEYYRVPQGRKGFHFEAAPQLVEFFKIFPPNLIVLQNRTRLKYVPTAMMAFDEPLENNEAFCPNGKSAISIYTDLVHPALVESGVVTS